MATKLAQTPGFWIDAAGVGRFSADCVAAMLACGLNPDHFGSYSDVRDKCDAAKQRVAKWNAAKRIEDPVERAAEMNRQGGPPSAEDYYLAKCQSGHIMQNATAQATTIRNPSPPPASISAGRHDRCANIVDGYSQNGAPAMPMNREEHRTVGAMEASQANGHAQGAGHSNQPGRQTPRGLDYSQEQRRADQRERNGEYVRAHVDSRQRRLCDTRAAKERSAYEDTVAEATGAAKSGDAAGTDDGSPSKPSGPAPSDDVMDKAADCLSEAAEKSEDQMIADCGKNASANAEQAASPAHQAEVERLGQERDAAAQAHQESRDAWRQYYADQREGKNPARPTNPPPWETGPAARQASDRYDEAASLGCYAEQGRRIQNGQGNTDGRIPGGAFDPNTPPSNPTVNPHPCDPPAPAQSPYTGGAPALPAGDR